MPTSNSHPLCLLPTHHRLRVTALVGVLMLSAGCSDSRSDAVSMTTGPTADGNETMAMMKAVAVQPAAGSASSAGLGTTDGAAMGPKGPGGQGAVPQGRPAPAMGAGSDGADGVPDVMVELVHGTVGGTTLEGGARRFLKIPYAAPPLGDLRWRAPADPKPWEGIRFETEFSRSCPQLMDQGAPASDNEDCLYLNVWAPEPQPTASPVMMWIHGGGNFSGGAGIPIPTTNKLWYDGQVLAASGGVVVVTINYRLGPLGFMAHPGLADEGSPAGNQGLLDQRKALAWIRDNIAAFGGDPNNVTIFGESAGSANVCYQVASPGSRGLFHRAISQSGGCTMRRGDEGQSSEEVASKMIAYAEALGCAAGEGQLACMRQAPMDSILGNSMQPMPGDGSIRDPQWAFTPVVDGPEGFLPSDARSLFDAGEISDVPYLLGSNNDEGTIFLLRAERIMTEADYRADLEARYGEVATDVFDLYPPSDYADDYMAALSRVLGDALVCSTYDTALRAAAAGRSVFMYNFNMPWALNPMLLGAAHAAEISHAFGTPHLPGKDPEADQQSAAVADAMLGYWTSFAKSGDPNNPEAPATWPAFAPENDLRLELAPGYPTREAFRAKHCTFWRSEAGVL